MFKRYSPLLLFFVTVLVIAVLALFGPEEQSLGSNVKIVYLHGAWVLAAELTFAIVGTLMQIGLWLVNLDWVTSLANLVFFVALRAVFATAADVMHPPPSPIFNSGLWNIIIFFVLLNIFAWLAAYFLTRWFLTLKTEN